MMIDIKMQLTTLASGPENSLIAETFDSEYSNLFFLITKPVILSIQKTFFKLK